MSIENLYPSVKPSLDLNFAAGNFDPRITFSRASGGTVYDGKTVAKAEENLLTYSQEFDNAAWVKTTSTVIANSFAAPDGTVSADTVTAASADSKLLQTFSATADPHTFSVYLYRKTGAGNVDISVDGVTWVTQTVTSGWVRFSTTLTPSAGAKTAGIRLAVSGDEVYIWGAQLEKRSQATGYTPTTSQPITNYIPVLQTAPANVPRIDYDPITGECKGLLIEEQRTNLLTYSEQFNHSNWLNISCGVRANSFVSPDGTISADLIAGTALVTSYVTQTLGVSASATYVASVFVKQVDSQNFQLKITNIGRLATVVYYNFSWAAGIPVESVTSACTVTPVGNGFFRVSFPFNSGSYTNIEFLLYPDSSNGPKSIVFWGAQLEAGAFPTSYIKTEASQVTRAADSASMTGANFSSWYRQDEGTLLSLVVSPSWGAGAISSAASSVSLTDGTQNNSIYFGRSATSTRPFLNSNVAGVTQADVTTSTITWPANTVMKIAGSYKLNDYAVSTDTSPAAVDTSAAVPAVSQLQLGALSNIRFWNGHIKRITYYPKRLSNTELQALTT